jgi:hypothetical protein
MNNATLKTPTGEKLKVTYPDSWDEITLDQFMKIEKLGIADPLTLFSILAGVELDFASGLDQELEPLVWDSVYFLFGESPDWKEAKCPKMFIIDGKPYAIPKIEKQTLGQSVMVTQLVNNSETLFEVIPEMLAIYFQPLVTGGKFDREKIDIVRQSILKSTAVDCMGVANFFLRKPKLLRLITQVGSHLLNPIRYQFSLTMVPIRSMAVSHGLIT